MTLLLMPPDAEQTAKEGTWLCRALRAGRRNADYSQRELAWAARVSPATVARLEAGRDVRTTVATVERLLEALGLRLAVVDRLGGEVTPHVSDAWRNAGGRRLPPHLAPRPTAGKDDWWWWGWLQYSTWLDPPIPTYSYFRNRRGRDAWLDHVDPWRER